MNAYKQRVEIEKFSHKATLEDIKENGNIHRYFDIFEEKEPIDIQAIRTELLRL